MEDAHTTLLDFLQNQGVHFFAVYDGHGGSAVAKFAGANTHKILAKEPAFAEGKHAEALVSAFLNMDNAIRVGSSRLFQYLCLFYAHFAPLFPIIFSAFPFTQIQSV